MYSPAGSVIRGGLKLKLPGASGPISGDLSVLAEPATEDRAICVETSRPPEANLV